MASCFQLDSHSSADFALVGHCRRRTPSISNQSICKPPSDVHVKHPSSGSRWIDSPVVSQVLPCAPRDADPGLCLFFFLSFSFFFNNYIILLLFLLCGCNAALLLLCLADLAVHICMQQQRALLFSGAPPRL